MRNCFTLLSKSGKKSIYNAVSSQYPIELGKGKKLFDRVCAFYKKDGISLSIDAPAEHLNTKYLGGGVTCVTIRAVFNFENQVNITSLSVMSEDGVYINFAYTQDDYLCKGEICVIFCSYISVGGGVEFSSASESFFNFLIGYEKIDLTAAIMDGGNILYSTPVNCGYLDGKIVISFTVNDEYQVEKVAFFAGNQQIFVAKTEDYSVGGRVVCPTDGFLPVLANGKEITEISGSAVTLSDTVVRAVVNDLGQMQDLLPLYKLNIENIISDPLGEKFACPCKGGLTLYVKNDSFCAKKAFFSHFRKDNIKSFCFNSTKLYILSDTFCAVDSSNGNLLAEYSIDQACNRVFATNDCVIITDSDGFGVYLAGDTLAMQKFVYATDATYAFDFTTSTLTVITEGSVKQYVFNGVNYTSYSYSLNIASGSLTARFGMVAVVGDSFITAYNLLAGVNKTLNAKGKIICSEGATYFTENVDGVSYLYRLDTDFVKLGQISTLEDVCLTACGAIFADGYIMPCARFVNRFEILSQNTAGDYYIYEETPYFAQKTYKIILEGVI